MEKGVIYKTYNSIFEKKSFSKARLTKKRVLEKRLAKNNLRFTEIQKKNEIQKNILNLSLIANDMREKNAYKTAKINKLKEYLKGIKSSQLGTPNLSKSRVYSYQIDNAREITSQRSIALIKEKQSITNEIEQLKRNLDAVRERLNNLDNSPYYENSYHLRASKKSLIDQTMAIPSESVCNSYIRTEKSQMLLHVFDSLSTSYRKKSRKNHSIRIKRHEELNLNEISDFGTKDDRSEEILKQLKNLRKQFKKDLNLLKKIIRRAIFLVFDISLIFRKLVHVLRKYCCIYNLESYLIPQDYFYLLMNEMKMKLFDIGLGDNYNSNSKIRNHKIPTKKHLFFSFIDAENIPYYHGYSSVWRSRRILNGDSNIFKQKRVTKSRANSKKTGGQSPKSMLSKSRIHLINLEYKTIRSSKPIFRRIYLNLKTLQATRPQAL